MPGHRYEREFVRLFNDTDHWFAQRAATSGAGTNAPLPDVTFAHDGLSFAGELKTIDGPYIYVDDREVDPLQEYAAAYGMHAVVIGRFKGERAFYVWNPNDMDRTDAGSLRGSPEDGQWAAKVADPGGSADGVAPGQLTGFHLKHGLAGKLGQGIVEPSPFVETDGGDA